MKYYLTTAYLHSYILKKEKKESVFQGLELNEYVCRVKHYQDNKWWHWTQSLHPPLFHRMREWTSNTLRQRKCASAKPLKCAHPSPWCSADNINTLFTGKGTTWPQYSRKRDIKDRGTPADGAHTHTYSLLYLSSHRRATVKDVHGTLKCRVSPKHIHTHLAEREADLATWLASVLQWDRETNRFSQSALA